MTTIVPNAPALTMTAPVERADVVRLDEVGVRLGDRWALDRVTLDIQASSVIGVLGCNGAGKTTLLRALCGLVRPTLGRVSIFGRSPPAAVRDGTGIGFVGHAPMLYADLTVRENLEFFAKCHRVPDVSTTVNDVLRTLVLEQRASDRCGTLSRGLQQRVAFARALVHDPALLLIDEPMTGLDEASQKVVGRCIRERRERGAVIVVTGHDVERLIEESDRVIVLREGGIRLDQRSSSIRMAEVRVAIGGGI